MPALREIDDAALLGPLAAAFGSASVELLTWHLQPIHYAFNQSTGGLYRLAGKARRAGATHDWSMILKVVHTSDGPFGGSNDPAHPNYWKRELLMYESGMLEEIPGIRAPRCFGVDHVDRGTAWIWLEDIADHVGSSWPAHRYEGAARRLGEFNGAYLNGRPLPTEDHLSRQWLRGFVDGLAPAFADMHEVRNHPLARRCWPEGQFQRVQLLWADRGTLLDALDQLPQTFCHLDAFPRNLLVQDGDEEVVALDWSYAGIGAVGSELASMAAASVCFHDAEPDQLSRIDELVFNGYLQGLRAAGWQGPEGAVRLGATAAASLHYGLFPMGVYLLDEDLRDHFERVFGHSAFDIADRWAQVCGFLLDQADEARDLLRRLSSNVHVVESV